MTDHTMTAPSGLSTPKAIGFHDAMRALWQAHFYGAKSGARLTKLLKEHINAAVGVLVAAKSGDAWAIAKAKAAFY